MVGPFLSQKYFGQKVLLCAVLYQYFYTSNAVPLSHHEKLNTAVVRTFQYLTPSSETPYPTSKTPWSRSVPQLAVKTPPEYSWKLICRGCEREIVSQKQKRVMYVSGLP